jgi:hypothetical protein
MAYSSERDDRNDARRRALRNGELGGDYARDEWDADLGGDYARDESRPGLGGEYAPDTRWGGTGAAGDNFVSTTAGVDRSSSTFT